MVVRCADEMERTYASVADFFIHLIEFFFELGTTLSTFGHFAFEQLCIGLLLVHLFLEITE